MRRRYSRLITVAVSLCGAVAGCERGAPLAVSPDKGKQPDIKAGGTGDPNHQKESAAQLAALYQHIAAGQGNVAFSPLDLSSEFAALSLGARGKTADEIAAAFRLPAGADKVAGRFDDLWARLERGPRPPYRLGIRVASTKGGAEVLEVFPDTPAHRVGLVTGDVILQVDEAPVADATAFANAMDRPGPSVDLRVRNARNDVNTFRIRLTPDRDAAATTRAPRVGRCVALWHQKGIAVKDDFRTAIETRFHGTVRELDADPKAAAERVNKWLGERTGGLLAGGVAPTDVTGERALLLTGAVWFVGEWADPFDKKKTAPDTFHVSPQKDIKVPFMRRGGEYTVGKGEGFLLIELPYRGGAYAMTVLLPTAGESLKGAEAALAKPDFGVPPEKRQRQETLLALPRFDVTGEVRLREPLAKLGVKTAFDAAADFSDIAAGGLRLADVTHRARVRVDEDGTSAAASTVMHLVAAGGPPPTPFEVNRPFLFVIREVRTGEALFVGRVAAPLADE